MYIRVRWNGNKWGFISNPRTLRRRERGFDPKHVQTDDLRVVDHPIIFWCAAIFWVLLADDMRHHETMWHVWSLMAKSCVHAPLLHKGENKKNNTGWWFQTFFIFHSIWDNPSHWLIGFAAYVTKAHKMSSQLSLRECSWRNDSEPLAESLHLLLHAWRPGLNIQYFKI